MIFKETTSNPNLFFDFLPLDWKDEIVPFWPDYQNSARIFILENDEGVLGGGIVFSTVSPDTIAFRDEAQQWYDAGYLYIAFLFISEKHRGQQLGSRWLQHIFQHFPNQPFWLSIEDTGLLGFYEKNGFVKMKEVQGKYGEEWILARPAEVV